MPGLRPPLDVFVTLKKLSTAGVEQPVTVFGGTAPHPGAWGKMRVSHRELDSFLQIPVIPPKYDENTVFVVNPDEHPTHPIFS